MVDTLPAVRRFRGGASPPLAEPPLPPGAPLDPSPLVAGVVTPVLELSASFAEEEEDDSACWFEGAKERKADILYAGEVGGGDEECSEGMLVYVRLMVICVVEG